MREVILGEMEWFGVQELADSAVIVPVRIKTRPGKQWAVGRALNGEVKRIFDACGLEIPFRHQTIYFGIDKNGDAPPARSPSRRKSCSSKNQGSIHDRDRHAM